MKASALILTTLLIAAPATAQTVANANANVDASRVGTIVIAHGGSDDWNAPVFSISQAARTGGPVEVALLMGDAAPRHRFQDAVARLVERGVERIVVVPLLASSHSGHYEQIRWLAAATDELDENMRHHLHMAGIERSPLDVAIVVTPAIDASMEIATILSERALNLAAETGQQALFIVGHGPNSAEDHAGWMANLRPVADSVARLTGFRDVKIGLVRDDAPAPVRAEAVLAIRETIELQRELTGRPVVVVPVLISKGYVSERLRRDLAGLDIAYDAEGLLPHPELARWIERRVREAGALEARSANAAAPAAAHSAGAHAGH